MISVEDYYKTTHKTSANSRDFELVEQDFVVFPKEGIYIGEFESVTGNRIPALIPLDQTNGVCFLTTPDNEKEIKRVMQMMALRLVCSIPPSKCKMILYDGQGVGNELIMLSGLSASIKGESIIDNPDVLKEKLKEVKKEIAYNIQTILGFEYADKTLVDYNMESGAMSVPYTIVVIADFPHALDKEASDLLLHIVKNGPKAGVFVIMNLDTSVGLENDKNDLRFIDQKPFIDLMTLVYQSDKNDRYYIKNLLPNYSKSNLFKRFSLHLDASVPENLKDVISHINDRDKNAHAAKLDISDMFTKDNLWKGDASEEVKIPIGMAYDRTIQHFRLGKEHYHCLIGGQSGSGKSVLLHNIICNGSWLYSPDELQFVLLDFKEGVEFNAYRDFPNVKILSVQSDTAFALNVFRFLNEDKKERLEEFKKKGASKLKEYNQRAPKRLPRYLIIIDEFQILYNTSYRTKDELDGVIKELAMQIRAVGGDLVMGTQALSGLSLPYLSEISLRIGLQFSSETECRKITYDSVKPLSFEKGQALYCDKADGKSSVQFRVAYLDKTMIASRLQAIQSSGLKYSVFERYIFDGETPANINNIIRDEKADKDAIYLGSPLSLKKEHAFFKFKREQGSNWLIVGQDVTAATSMVFHSIQQMITTVTPKDAIYICDKTSEESPTHNKLAEINTDKCHYFYLNKDNDITMWIDSVNKKIEERRSGIQQDYGEIYLVLFNTFNYQPALMREELLATTTGLQLVSILQNGPNYGIHLIVYSDTYDHYLATFGKSHKYEWGIKSALSGGDSERMFGNDEDRKIKSPYISFFMKTGRQERNAEKIMVYEL